MAMTYESVAVAITLDNGELAVMQFLCYGRGSLVPFGAVPVNGEPGWWAREASPENVAWEVTKTFLGHVEQPVGWRVIDKADIPTDRSFRKAWRDSGKSSGAIAHDMDVVRQMQLDRIRAARVPELARLDVATMQALVAKDDTALAEAEAAKQTLRDIPQTLGVEACTTMEEVKALWPDELAQGDVAALKPIVLSKDATALDGFNSGLPLADVKITPLGG